MEKTSNKLPVFRNNKVSLVEKKKAEKVIRNFADVLYKRFQLKQREGRTGWDNPDPENLLYLRKQLVKNIKEGMLERKDQEEDIALLACFIWFNRLEHEKKLAIEQEWG
jgi:hypothetical protein